MAIIRRIGLILIFAIAGGVETIWAQAPPLHTATPAAAAAVEPDGTRAVRLLVGHSTVVDTGAPIARVSLTSPDIADALVTSNAQLLVHGKAPGSISLFVWSRSGAIQRYEVIVQRDIVHLTQQVAELFPGEAINVEGSGRNIVLSGHVSSKDVADRAVSLAGGYVDKKDDVVNLMQLAEGGPRQVLLRVRFAEVSRSAVTELGSSFFTGPGGFHDYVGRVTTEQFAAPDFKSLTRESIQGANNWGGGRDTVTGTGGEGTFSDFLNLFLFNNKYNVGTLIRAMQQRGLFQSLAEPNLVAESGKEASFLAGGEIPIPVAQGTGGTLAITVQYKEFGIRLTFTPVVIGNRVRLKVRPEVSTLDFNNAVVLQGFRIPALSTRRTETELELENGQTFAIAGLMNNQVSSTMRKVPGIGDIPILGLLFKSKAAQKDRTELVVMITPQILPQNSPGVTSDLPRNPEKFLAPQPDNKTTPAPPPAFQQGSAARPMAAAPAAAAGPVAAKAPAAQASPATAAAAVSALTPKGPVVAQPSAASAGSPGDAPAATAAPRPREMTSEEKQAVERAREQEELKRKAEEKVREAQAKRAAKQAEQDRREAKKEQERQEKLAREQARRDAKAAKEAARQAAEEQRRAEEEAKRQAEIDRKQQEAVAEAADRLKEAQLAYEAELAKKNGSK